MELALREAQRESELQRARAMEQGDLIAMLTHELKTPLSVVSLALGDLGRQPAMRARALLAVDNMRGVIDRCALTARVDEDAGHRLIELKLEPLLLNELLDVAIGTQVEADRIETNVHEPLPACRGDRMILLIILSNLLDNALKYSPAESVIRAEVRSGEFNERSGVVLRVSNEITDQDLLDPKKIFDKYYRGARARHRSGSGLGLYVSRRLARRVGGELWFRLEEASRASFELWLPLRATP